MDFELGNCEQCPHMIHINQEIRHCERYKSRLGREAMDSSIDETVAPAIFELLKESLGPHFSELEGEGFSSPEEFASFLRKQTGEALNKMDDQIEGLQKEIKELTDKCHGPLKMRATKAGRVITATICNSPIIPNGVNCEEIHALRSSAS